MKEEKAKELRRQLVHASGIVLVPLALAFGKFLVGAAAFLVALIIFALAEQKQCGNEKTAGRNCRKSVLQHGIKSNSKRLFGMPKNQRFFAHLMSPVHIAFEKFERSGGNYRGAFYFYIASAVSLFVFPLSVAMLSITVLALGDSFSTAAGVFGKHRIFYNRRKTWEGTIAGFIASFAGCLLISPALALPAAFTGMLVESLPLKVDDNLTIPILTGIVLSIFISL